MTPEQVRQLLGLNKSYIYHAKNGDFKNKTADLIRSLLNFELDIAEYFRNPLMEKLCDTVIYKAKKTQSNEVLLASNCKRLHYVENQDDGGSQVQQLDAILNKVDKMGEVYFFDVNFPSMCQIAIENAAKKDVDMKEFAGELYYLSIKLQKLKQNGHKKTGRNGRKS